MFDLVVVGAGIGGGSLVYNLLDQGFRGSILVVDRGEGVASGPTGHSAGGFRNLWTTTINLLICNRSIEILRDFQQHVGCSIGFRPCGYLFCHGPRSWSGVPRAAEFWAAHGVRFELWEPEQMEGCIPGLQCGVQAMDAEVREVLGLEPLVGGVFGLDCGCFDPSQAASGYFQSACRDFPVRPFVQFCTEAEAIQFEGDRVCGIRLRSGGVDEMVGAGIVALCSGPWTNELLRRSGVAENHLLPILSQKRMLFVSDFPSPDPRWAEIPLTVIDRGIYFKAEGDRLLMGKAKPDTPHGFDTTLEPDYYREEINLIMQERLPAAARCRLQTGWASLYDTTSPDHNAIVGWHEAHPGLLLQAGYSGHGAMESPAVGEALASLILTGHYQGIDCSPLSWSRFDRGALLTETIIL